MRDEFLSEEDLDLKSLSEEELYAWWDLWLEQAQATNDLDDETYSHGVFAGGPSSRQGRQDEEGKRDGEGRARAARPGSPKSAGPRGGGRWDP